jgi:uncharacterized protein
VSLVQVWNESTTALIAGSVEYDADRGLGLMFHRNLGPEHGARLEMDRTSRVFSSIHMFFVFIPLAVFWLDRNRFVVDKALARPFRPFYMPRHPALYVLELHASKLDAAQIGDLLAFIQIP